MAQFDSTSNMLGVVALNTTTIATSTSTNGNIIDMQGYNSLTGFLQVGARTDGSYTMKWQHGDLANGTDMADVDATDIPAQAVNTTAAVTTANSVRRLGYVGNKRYVRPAVVSTGVTTGATVGVLAVQGRPSVGPTPAN